MKLDGNGNKETRLNPELAKRPVLELQPIDLIHTRRNLLIIVSIYLFCVISDVSFSPKFFNENFIDGGLTENDVSWAILLITLYLFVSFCWKFSDFYRSQIILTTHEIELYSVGHIGDVTEKKSYREPGQYSLSAWWARTSEKMQFYYDEIEKKIEKLDEDVNIRKQVDLIRTDTRIITDMYLAASNDDVINSLKNFDKSVLRFIYSQKLRVNILDFALPTLMSVASISLLFYELVLKDWLNIFLEYLVHFFN